MFQVEKGEIATRLFEDMADSRSGKLDDEMTKLGVWRPGHLLEAGTSHRSSSRLASVVRSLEDEMKLSNILVHHQLGAWSCRMWRGAATASEYRSRRGHNGFFHLACP